jgi:LL-diaminopimelate aminotransferase
MVEVKASSKLAQLGSAIFAEMDGWKTEVRRSGLDIIDLGIGSPDRAPSPIIMQAMEEAVRNPKHYGYPSSAGSPAFREAIARWYEFRFGVQLNPETEVLVLMGSQDGLAHLALSIAEPGDMAIVPDPGYPIYAASLVLAGVESYPVPLREEEQFLPNWSDIPADIARKSKFLILNYPGNPIAAVADLAFFKQAVEFAKQHELLIVHDLAYSEMAFDNFIPPSILQIEGAKEVCVEFHSLSKSFNMAGCRIGFMVGHPDAVKALSTLKSNIDYGVFHVVQQAGIAALEEDMSSEGSVAPLYEKRRDLVIEGLAEAGWIIPKPKATMFIWARIPTDWTSRQISQEILYSTGVVVIPGDAFGSQGEGYVRIALVQEEDVLREAVRRISEFLKQHKN